MTGPRALRSGRRLTVRGIVELAQLMAAAGDPRSPVMHDPEFRYALEAVVVHRGWGRHGLLPVRVGRSR